MIIPGPADRRGLGDPDDATRLRAPSEGVAAGDQAQGEVPRRPEAGSRQRRAQAQRSDGRRSAAAGEQGTTGAAHGAAASATQEAAAPPLGPGDQPWTGRR